MFEDKNDRAGMEGVKSAKGAKGAKGTKADALPTGGGGHTCPKCGAEWYLILDDMSCPECGAEFPDPAGKLNLPAESIDRRVVSGFRKPCTVSTRDDQHHALLILTGSVLLYRVYNAYYGIPLSHIKDMIVSQDRRQFTVITMDELLYIFTIPRAHEWVGKIREILDDPGSVDFTSKNLKALGLAFVLSAIFLYGVILSIVICAPGIQFSNGLLLGILFIPALILTIVGNRKLTESRKFVIELVR
ncbi:MAG: hypothetical protein ACTSUE_17995 [Promethearchaeota archaeon]